ncbi:MAG: response regulator, partial [Candidatus Omnitrophica bacterium]|nr:response regulator [Candidatus Omnitrophota bacterium]
MAFERRILLVDDNPQYRSAVTRNLTLQKYTVIEAEDSVEGMDKIQTDDPQVIITDLDMRTHDEGLHFIREVKQRYPQKPVIMISAVGSFDEGALARQYGATFVLSKSRIDAEIETLYQRLDRIYQILGRISALRERVEKVLNSGAAPDDVRAELDSMLRDDDLDAGLKSEVYELLDRLDRSQASPQGWMEVLDEKAVLQSIQNEIPEINNLDAETRTMLAVAESMQQSGSASSLSVARNVSFSYSFAVE